MVDYGRPLQFGISLAPAASDTGMILEAARVADLSLDMIGFQDHPYQRRFLDTSALIAKVAAETSRLRVFHDVACLPLRPPAMLANEAAAIDILSQGRFELGLGAGSFWDAIAGMGGPRRSPREALEALEEAVAVIRMMWSGERGLRFDGKHYRLSGIHSGPLPVHDIEIWFGVYGPKACALLGRVADGWLPSLGRMSPGDLSDRHEIIDQSASEAGRDPSSIRRMLNVSGRITEGSSEGHLIGPASQWVDQLGELVLRHGFDTFVYWPEDDPVDQIHRFAGITSDVAAVVDRERQV
ncbi:MAG TPA: LLM class flavin-dependent oxidoreductase [Acidimicrobiia bacterium]|nr:LLM class flavin-dependent oxidoreductase [Acidimicrobiia bacterium]